MDAEGKILYVNPAFSAMTGYGHREILDKNPRILKPGKQDATFYTSMCATIGGGQVTTTNTLGVFQHLKRCALLSRRS